MKWALVTGLSTVWAVGRVRMEGATGSKRHDRQMSSKCCTEKGRRKLPGCFFQANAVPVLWMQGICHAQAPTPHSQLQNFESTFSIRVRPLFLRIRPSIDVLSRTLEGMGNWGSGPHRHGASSGGQFRTQRTTNPPTDRRAPVRHPPSQPSSCPF